MGREIRKVPKGWVHPQYEPGPDNPHNWTGPKPLYDNDFETVAEEWCVNNELWRKGKHPSQLKRDADFRTAYPYFWMYAVQPPDSTYYRPKWTEEERTCLQIYETVTEGTPVSPVFETGDDLVHWMVQRGTSEKAARRFLEEGWVPSMTMNVSPSGIRNLKANFDQLED